MTPGPDLVLSAAQTSFMRVPLSSASPIGLGSEADVLKRRPLGRSHSCDHRWNKPEDRGRLHAPPPTLSIVGSEGHRPLGHPPGLGCPWDKAFPLLRSPTVRAPLRKSGREPTCFQ